MQPFKNRTKIKNILNVWQRVHKNLYHLKGRRLANSLQVLHYLRKQQCRDQFLLSAMPLPKSLTSAELLGGILPRGVSESVQYIILWSSQWCLWSCWGPCQENRSLQPLLRQKSISLKSWTEGVICLCRLQQWVINWQRSKHCTRMPIKSLCWLLEPRTTGEYFTDTHFDFKKCF